MIAEVKTREPLIFALALGGTILTFFVVVLGAFVRLTDAGLGCPDWPGCYGHLDVPRTPEEIAAAEQVRPERPVDITKAWIEMIHRYVAGGLGLLILAIAITAWRRRHRGVPWVLPFALVALVLFQSLLGMWTVTLLLKPAIVTAHLAGGLLTLSLMAWLTLAHAPRLPSMRVGRGACQLGYVAMVVLCVQILLGGWTSTNYAALACTDFPTCQGEWWPEMDFGEGFRIWRGLGVDYEFGVLDSPAMTAVHKAHRLGAIAATLALGAFALLCLASRRPAAQFAGATVLGLLMLQLALGVGNVVFHLPLWLATAHNGGAALLLVAMVAALYMMAKRDVSA